MLSATGQPVSRPRPPGQRRRSYQDAGHQHPQPADKDALSSIRANVSADVATQPSRPLLSDVKNTVPAATTDAVCAYNHPGKSTVQKTQAQGAPASSDSMVHASPRYEAARLSPSTSEEEIDHIWLGSLDRYELEELLIQASRKVREREQKLVVAANIGKALLEKNLSLRSGIMSSMASSSSICGLADVEAMINGFSVPQAPTSMHDSNAENLDPTPSFLHPMNSPPTTDVDNCSQYENSPGRAESDITPIAHPMFLPDPAPDYFSRPTTEEPRRSEAVAASAGDGPAPTSDGSMWVPDEAGLIVSQPCSPSASISSYASQALLSPLGTLSRPTSKMPIPAGGRHRSRPSLMQLQAFEAQRQLASLGEQNDVLHQQISELQYEAEHARCEGSKKLSRLNKEIRGLKAELEVATRRNIELESSSCPSRAISSPRSTRKEVTDRHRLVTSSPRLLRVSGGQEAFTAPLGPIPDACVTDQPSPSRQDLVPSTSNLEALVHAVRSNDGESALLVQLLAKIKELEETNAAMAKAEEDFGCRMGRAMQEDERLRDAFNTMGQDIGVEAIPSDAPLRFPNPSLEEMAAPNPELITPSHSLRSLHSIVSEDISSLIASMSPNRKRRAPGNRHVIEHRKTVRTAIRRTNRELAQSTWALHHDDAPASKEYMSRSSTEQSLGTYSIDLSGSSSAASSPRPRALNRKASTGSTALGPSDRPRIRITPSIEDLGRRRKMQEQVVASPVQNPSSVEAMQVLTSPASPAFLKQDSLCPSDAMQAYETRMTRQSCSSRDDLYSPAKAWKGSDASPRPSSNIPYLSPAQQRSFNPTARVRRSRSRSSSFGSDVPLEYHASAEQQGLDPFMSSWKAWKGQGPQLSPSPASSLRGRTLGSELGSIFGGDDRKNDFDDDLPQRRRVAAMSFGDADRMPDLKSLVLGPSSLAMAVELPPNVVPAFSSDRPTADVGRLVPESHDEHEADLECVLTQSVRASEEIVVVGHSPLARRDAALLARVEAEERGAWLADQPIIEPGGLHDEDEPRGAQFDLINAVVQHQAVAWADDDDYGRTLSQREAVKLGLLAPRSSPLAGRGLRTAVSSANTVKTNFGMTWSSDVKDQSENTGTRAKAPVRLQLESAQQFEDRLRIESLLRKRRRDLLRVRGFEEGIHADPQEQEQEAQLLATYAPSPPRMQEKRRRALMGGRGVVPPASPGDASASERDPRRSTQQWVQELICASPTTKGRFADDDAIQELVGLDDIWAEENDFELLDCPSWKKQGGRGTDYFPTSFRARYRPAMVRQRVVHVSRVTYGWVEEWVQFAFVVFLAFVVMVEQGPTGTKRRGQSATPVIRSLLNGAE